MNKVKHTTKKDTRSMILQVIYEGTVEILGTLKTEQIFSAISDEEMNDVEIGKENQSSILEFLVNEFAIRFHRNTAKGLMVRIGEASFTYLKKKNQGVLALGDIENRLNPIALRFSGSLKVLADVLSELTELNINLLKKGDSEFCLEILGGISGKILASDLYLYYIMGILRAFCLWLDSRKEYSFTVEEGRNGDTSESYVCLKIEEKE